MPYIGQAPAPKVITSSDLSADVVTEAKIADNAVENEHLNANVITGHTALAATPADTDELLISDAGTLKRIDYSYLKSGGLNLINRTTVSAGTYVSFDQILDGTYSTIQCIVEGVQPASTGGLNLQFQVQTTSESSGSYFTSSNYYWSALRHTDGNGTSATGQAFGRVTRDGGGTNSGERGVAGILSIYQTDSTTRHKFWDFHGATHQQDGSRYGLSAGGNVETTDRLTGIRFYYSSGDFLAKGAISIYGITTS